MAATISPFLFAAYLWSIACCLCAFGLQLRALTGCIKKDASAPRPLPVLVANIVLWTAQSAAGAIYAAYLLLIPPGKRHGNCRRCRQGLQTACQFASGPTLLTLAVVWLGLGTAIATSLSFLLVERLRCVFSRTTNLYHDRIIVVATLLACTCISMGFVTILLWHELPVKAITG